jgi:hypothetical protein
VAAGPGPVVWGTGLVRAGKIDTRDPGPWIPYPQTRWVYPNPCPSLWVAEGGGRGT